MREVRYKRSIGERCEVRSEMCEVLVERCEGRSER